MAAKLSIAHVTPYPWEAEENEVNAYVRHAARELSRRGHSVLVLAPSRSQERVRASRRALRAARERPQELLAGTAEGTPRVIAVGEVLDVPVPAWSALDAAEGVARGRPARALPIDVARTIEELLSGLELDFVHVHEPFAPSAANAALRHSRALNVGSFHAPTERVLSTLLGRRFVATFFGRLDVRTASFAATAELMARHFPAEYRLVAPADAARGPSTGEAGTGAARAGAAGAARAGAARTWTDVADDLERLYAELAARRRDPRGDPSLRRRLARRELIDVDMHMHTDHSSDCATPVEVLLATAREQNLGAIVVTDHNEISGALAAREQAEGQGPHPPLKVIVGEEVKTASEGEVIGLFIEERIPRGLSMAETVAEIKRQGGLVYVPHPFDRMHAVPDYEHLLPILEEVDAIEVFNPRVAIGAFNEEAARFAAKYRIAAGAGSDAHVAQGLGSVRVRMRDFEGPQEFLQSLRDAEILTRPTSLLYVQALKFLQTRATPPAARRASRARRVRRATDGGGKSS
ncbi:MAG TPA: PHP-associated domain-containing protein [Solirubrobacteraceae bacterium]|jgi:predicted metal-dependent phosphoesterase TrpH|nr:PHP-associated domain-containing protein [Solirubrobacteraceae bacterium]